jgi:hypothetical protein
MTSILAAKGCMNRYVRYTITMTYKDILTTSIVNVVKGISYGRRGYGYLSEHEVQSIPFEECVVDLIGPWIAQVHGNPYEFSALTAIDTVTHLVELIRVDDKTSETISGKYAQCWLSHYPWPQRCVHDPGAEFVGPNSNYF